MQPQKNTTIKTLFALSLMLASPVWFSGIAAQEPEKKISYDRDIRPILSDRCFACHGPDSDSREAGLRLDLATGDEGAHEYAIVPGDAEDSEVWNRIVSDDESEIMPPPSAHKKPLSSSEKQLIKKWIESGAQYETFWAFEPITRPTTPKPNDAQRSRHPIDQFVLHQLESAGLEPAESADARTLIRRVTFDLTGLPPTPTEIRDFLEDQTRLGDEQAWINLVDGLIDRPQFGEHMARYWLDLVRYADTNGMHKDFYRNNVEYRDWVIRAFNENLGYDDFLKFQLAGDLFEQPTEDQLIASGFHRLHLIIDRGTALPEESFTKNVIDRVTAVGTGFMGMTVHCAQCHDHKYDPISQKEFFSLYAFFNNIDAKPETVANPRRGLQQPFASFATEQQRKELATFDQQLSELDKQIAQLKKKVEAKKTEAAKVKKDATDGELKSEKPTETKVVSAAKELKELSDKLKKLQADRKKKQQQRERFDQTIRYAMTMKERDEVRPTFVLNRGQYDDPGDEVSRGTPEFLPPLKKKGEIATRMDLANWFVQPDHPLTARVAVNRFWQQFFGVGLVKTSEDFGAQGEVPSHPELLDYLSAEFIESDWDVKQLVKKIVLSKTYRQSSIAPSDQFKLDPENRMLARGSRFRMDAEMVRDQILVSSGLINQKMFGPSVKPPQPAGLWKAVTMTGQRFQADSGDAIYRRSIYTFWKRAMPPPQMTILNAPNRDACIARRERTNTPSQALLLLNEAEYFKAARELATQTLKQDSKNRIAFVWEKVTSKLPDQNESSMVAKLVTELKHSYEEDQAQANEICSGLELGDDVSKSELAAWTVVANTLYNLDIVKTRE